jgi:gluconokinase
MKASAIVIMGVSGCGKSTVGQAMSKETGIPFFDADDYHPQENIDKMSVGIPLTDTDRMPWLDILGSLIKEQQNIDGIILACSALKKSYRNILNLSGTVKFIYLDVSKEELIRRLDSRKGHYMPVSLLDSQMNTLELSDEVIQVDGNLPINQLLKHILTALKS